MNGSFLGDNGKGGPGAAFGLKPPPWQRYKVSIGQIGRFIDADTMISHIDKRWIAKFVTARQEEGVSNRTIRRDLDAFSAFYTWLKSQGRVEHDRVRDYDYATGLPELTEEIRVPTIREVQKIIDTFHRMPASLVAFQALTGLRQGEATMIEWNEIDLASASLIVPESKSNARQKVHLFGRRCIFSERCWTSSALCPSRRTMSRHREAATSSGNGDGEPYRECANYWRNVVHDVLGRRSGTTTSGTSIPGCSSAEAGRSPDSSRSAGTPRSPPPSSTATSPTTSLAPTSRSWESRCGPSIASSSTSGSASIAAATSSMSAAPKGDRGPSSRAFGGSVPPLVGSAAGQRRKLEPVTKRLQHMRFRDKADMWPVELSH